MSVVTGRVVLGHWERGTAKALGQRPLNQGIKTKKSLSGTPRVFHIFCGSFPTSPGGRGQSQVWRGKRGHTALQRLNPPARKYRGHLRFSSHVLLLGQASEAGVSGGDAETIPTGLGPPRPLLISLSPLLCYFQEKLRTALVSEGTDCQEFTCCSHEALHRLAASTALMRSYLRRLRRLHWQESGQRLHGRRPERSTKRQRKVEDEQEERLMSACLYNPSYSGAAGVLCD